MPHLLLSLCFGALTLVPVAAPVQEPVPAPPAAQDAEIHEQMRQLVIQIERTLREVDDLLWDRRGADKAPPSIAQRLHAARDGAKRAVEQIDKLFELGDHEHPPGGG
jgi:hypothetical protein